MEEKKAQWVPWPEFQEISKPKKFLSFTEATAWAMEQVENSLDDLKVIQKDGESFAINPDKKNILLGDKTKVSMTKEVSYQRWLIEVGELQEQLETQLDNAQDLWIAGEDFKSWLVKHEGAWFDVERSMKQVYDHIDSALHFLRIIRGVK